MIKYGKIINDETGLCEIALGNNMVFYKKLGYKSLDVKQSDIDNNYYLSEKCPMKTEEEKQKEEKERILELSMTRGDFFDGMIKAFGTDEKDLFVPIQQMLQQLQLDKKQQKIIINSYNNALNFYRKHPLFDMLSDKPIPISETETIVISAIQWDGFFNETDKKNPEAYKQLL